MKGKAQEISRQRGVAVAKAKAAADQRAKLIANAEKQVKAAKAKARQAANAAAKTQKMGEAIPLAAGEFEEIEEVEEAVAIPVSTPVVTRYSGPRAASNPRNVRSGRVVAVKLSTPTGRAPAVAKSATATAAAAAVTTAAPAVPDVPPPPPARSPAARAKQAAKDLQDDAPKARSQLEIVERTLEKGPAPYEAFRLYLQRSAILRVTQPDHADIPSAEMIDGMKQEIATARQEMGSVRNAPDWATLIHVWLLGVWGPKTYLMLDQLRLVESPWQLPEGQKVSLMLVYPPFVWLFRKPRGTGFIRDPRISLLQLDPYACSPSLDPGADTVRLTLAFADSANPDADARQRVVLEHPVRPDLGRQGTLEAVEDFLGDMLTVRSQYVKHVFQRLAARRMHRNTFDSLLSQLQLARSIPGLPERVTALRRNLDVMLRDAVFTTRPVEMTDPPFTQLLDLALEHKVLVGKDVRRRAQRIQQLFQRDDARLPVGMLENVALDFNMVNRSLLADRAPASRVDKAWDESFTPPMVKPAPAKPWTGIEGDPTSYIGRLVQGWAGGGLPVPR